MRLMLRGIHGGRMDTMTRNGLYQTLLQSMYALNGANGEFIAALATPINNVVVREESGTLAVIPSNVARRLVASIQWCEEAILEERAEWADEFYGSEEEEWASEATLLYISEMEADIATLRAELAAL